MSCNAYKPHLLILPEDEATQDLANGFQQAANVNDRAIQILPFSRGYRDVLAKLKESHISGLRQFQERRILLVIDFDDEGSESRAELSNITRRMNYIKDEVIPKDLIDRIFVLGVRDEPETFKRQVGLKFEEIGRELTRDCPQSQSDLWNHEMLQHNAGERQRLMESCGEFLFD